MALPPRLVFGEIAELYESNRPSYPAALVDDVLALAEVPPGTRVLEVGAGTGKATELFAARGVAVLAIEPSADMAAVARQKFAEVATVQIVECDFERWESAGARFPLLYSAQAWHWIEPEVRYERAHAALIHGGVLAAFWNRPAWGRSQVRDELKRAYASAVPALRPDGSLHPANPNPDGDDDWLSEIGATDGFDRAEVRIYEWRAEYTAAEYARLLGTLSEIRLLSESERDALLSGVMAAIDSHGGVLAMPYRSRLCLARAV